MRRKGVIVSALLCVVLATGCEDEDEETVQALASGPVSPLSVLVVQELEPDDNAEAPTPQEILTDSQSATVAYASVSQDVVPISFADASADPATDVLLVTVDLEDEFQAEILQVELSIQVGGSSVTWCEPMKRDELDDSLFYLKLQPACSEPSYRDPLTGDCVLVADDCEGRQCREDLLTFTLWGDTTSDCHEQADGGSSE